MSQLVSYGGARHLEVLEVETSGGDRITYKRTHFAFLFGDTSVHAAEVVAPRAQSLTACEIERYQYIKDKKLHKYIRNAFAVLSVVMLIAIIFSCAFMFSDAKAFIQSSSDYFIAVSVLFVVLAIIAFLIREKAGDEGTRKVWRWICMVPCHLMVVLLLAGLCCVDPSGFLFLSAEVVIFINFICLMLFGFQMKYIYSTYKGFLLVFCVNVLLLIIVVPGFWSGGNATIGATILGSISTGAFFSAFAIYDIIRLSDDDNSFCFNDLKKPEVRDWVWDSVHMFLEFMVAYIIVCIACALIFVVLACIICICFIDD
ncbi:hypothetical protein ScPMuIL_014044 [Solemya velum]